VEFLTAYQDADYAERYKALVERVREAEGRLKGSTGLAETVARYYFKLLAYKDEYEVARLYTDGSFRRRIEQAFDGSYRLHFHLAPPLLAKRDPVTGELQKSEYGGWVFAAFRILAKLRFLRGTALDVFGYTRERRMERQLIKDYEAAIELILDKLNADNHALAVRIAAIPEEIRGFGHVKERNIRMAKAKEAELLAALREPAQIRSAA
jgi:indolepyruvate ferredoxin oxidoreductase